MQNVTNMKDVTNTKLEPYNFTLNRDQTPLEVVQVIENATQVQRPSNKVSTHFVLARAHSAHML